MDYKEYSIKELCAVRDALKTIINYVSNQNGLKEMLNEVNTELKTRED